MCHHLRTTDWEAIEERLAEEEETEQLTEDQTEAGKSKPVAPTADD